jgi:hypothetical protein
MKMVYELLIFLNYFTHKWEQFFIPPYVTNLPPGDPDPDTYQVFRPQGSGHIITYLQVSGSGSFYQPAKFCRKT